MPKLFNKQPKTVEELMVAEYALQKEQIKDLESRLAKEQYDRWADNKKHDETIFHLQADKLNLEQRCEAIQSQQTGIIDLHETTQIFKIRVGESYYIKNYFPNGNANKIQMLKNWLNYPTKRLIREAQKIKLDYYGMMLDIEENKANLIIIPIESVPTKCAINLDVTDKVVKLNQKLTTNKWCVASFDNVINYAENKLRTAIETAIEELEKQEDE